jgi:23S rRNA pseudouridine1911/1915/1917 synthase
VHLADRGYPVIGDIVYGSTSKIHTITDSTLKSGLKALGRQALHAAELSFYHPGRNERIFFTAEMPEDMKTLCDLFRMSG